MLNGLLLKESLQDLEILDRLQVTKVETWNIQNPDPNQPLVWTAVHFEAEDSQADALAADLSRSLKPEGWFIDAHTEAWVYVIFPGRVFKYAKGNAEMRSQAVQHGLTLGIPQRQLDWGE